MQSARGRTLIVMPAYNEEASLAQVLREVTQKLPGVDILVVDDGSVDETTRVALREGAKVATLPFNLGVGGAMRTGFRYALERGYANVVQIDADGQHNPSDVPALLDGLSGADLVLGARFAGEGDYRVRGPRKWAMTMLGRALSKSAGTRLTDTTSGFRASGPRAVRLFAEHYPAEYLGDTIEALIIATRAGHVVRQVPVSMRTRLAGSPSQRPLQAAAYLARAVLALSFAFVRPVATIQLNSSEVR